MSVSKTDLLAALKQLNNCSIATIDSTTEVKLKGGKSNPQLGRVTKKMEGGNIMFFCNMNSNSYQNMVKKRLAEEGKDPETFQLGKRVWGERVPSTPFVLHKGELYVEAIFLKSPKVVKYFLDGKEIDKKDVIGLEDKEEGKQGGLDNKVIIRTYKLSSIDKVKMGALSVGC